MRIELLRLHEELKATMIYVTHDQVEAMTMADKIVVLQAGRVEQVGSPLELYHHPANLFVAGFIGSPRMNLLEAQVVGADGSGPDGVAAVRRPGRGAGRARHRAAGDPVTLGIRPEALRLDPDGPAGGDVRLVERLGGLTLLHVGLTGREAADGADRGQRCHPGARAGPPGGRPAACHLFDGAGQALTRNWAGIRWLPDGDLMFLGLDFGTSAVKALLVDGEQRRVGSATVPLTVQRPQPGHSEQDPEAWWQAMLDAVDTLGRDHAAALAAVQGIGLSGQMHGAVLLDAAGAVLRPAILWNDVRASDRVRGAGAWPARAAHHHRQHRHAGLHRAQAAVGATHEPAGVRPGAHGAAAQGLDPLSHDRRDDRGDVGRLRHAVAGRRRAGLVGRRCWPPPACPGTRCRAWWRATRPPDGCARNWRRAGA